MKFPLLPRLSEEDKAEKSEGGLDPLGLVQISESLGIRLVPGVRERMSHPRYLTAMAVGMEVCRDFSEDAVAADGITPPWLVFEWLMVEGLVRTAQGLDSFSLPGSQKAAFALRRQAPLSASRYLKTPSVFGFHGVYRGLARDLYIENAGRIGETGYDLVSSWSREQGLPGFNGSSGGKGADAREQLYWAVRESLDASEVKRGKNWQYWQFFRDHLAPDGIGSKEGMILCDALLEDASGFRGSVIRFLVSRVGHQILEKTKSERAFHNGLKTHGVAPDLQTLLEAIASYEGFCRIAQNAFDEILVELTRLACKTDPQELSRLASVRIAAKQIPIIFGQIIERLEPYRETAHFAQTFASLSERTDPAKWVERLLQHHVDVQRRKPPMGKSPWFERFDDGSVIIRPLYRRTFSVNPTDDSYLHGYRTWSLFSFAHDLHLSTV
jgi:hypothetical protein